MRRIDLESGKGPDSYTLQAGVMRFAGGRCGEAQLGWGTPGDKVDDWIIGQLPRATLSIQPGRDSKRRIWEKKSERINLSKSEEGALL